MAAGPIRTADGRGNPLRSVSCGRRLNVFGSEFEKYRVNSHWLYTLHDGKVFKVRYFCATCNIIALEPGNCVCCQQPTELQEVPVEK